MAFTVVVCVFFMQMVSNLAVSELNKAELMVLR